jgi:MFS family permease
MLKSLKLENKLYAYTFFFWNLPIVSFFTLMFSESGMSPATITACYIISSIAKVLFEIPIGILADKFSRRSVMLFGVGLNFLALGVVLHKSVITLAFSNALWGVVLAIYTSILPAFVYDELASIKREGEFSKIFGRMNATQNVGLAVSCLIAFWAVDYGYNTLIILSLGSILTASAVLLSIKETPRLKRVDGKNYFEIFREGISYAKKNTEILKISIFGAVIGSIAMIAYEFFSIFAKISGWERDEIALIFFGQIVVEAVISMFSKTLNKLSNRTIALMSMCSGVLFLLGAVYLSKLSVVLGWMLFVLNVVRIIVLNDRKQKLIPTDLRATLSSFEGFLSDSFQIPLRILFGVSATVLGYQGGFVALSIIAIVLTGGFGFFFFGRSPVKVR